MSKVRALVVTSLALALASTPVARAQQAQGQQPAMSAEQRAMMETWAKAMAVGENHQRLARMAGDWDMTTKAWMAPGQPPTESKGTVTNTMLLGGRVLQSQQRGVMMGQPFEGVGLTGYDNVTGRHWTTWLDNMSTGPLSGCRLVRSRHEHLHVHGRDARSDEAGVERSRCVRSRS